MVKVTKEALDRAVKESNEVNKDPLQIARMLETMGRDNAELAISLAELIVTRIDLMPRVQGMVVMYLAIFYSIEQKEVEELERMVK